MTPSSVAWDLNPLMTVFIKRVNLPLFIHLIDLIHFVHFVDFVYLIDLIHFIHFIHFVDLIDLVHFVDLIDLIDLVGDLVGDLVRHLIGDLIDGTTRTDWRTTAAATLQTRIAVVIGKAAKVPAVIISCCGSARILELRGD